MKKMNRSESGRLGGIASIETSKKLKEERIAKYNENPKSCKGCDTPLEYYFKRNSFCSQSCSATYYNLKRGNKDPLSGKYLYKKLTFICLSCKTEQLIRKGGVGKYCSNICQKNHQMNESISNGTASSKTLKRYLISIHSNKCWTCGIIEWNQKPIVMELEHIDGDSNNNSLENLSIICPNCHSQTDTYKGKNKGKGRFSRRQRYKEGKSY